MVAILCGVGLQKHNTFGISEMAERLVWVESDQALRLALDRATRECWDVTLLGGGSNIVLSGTVHGLVIGMRSRGRRIVSRGPEHVIIEAEAGENWHALVGWSLDHGLSGLENLALIPGTAGAAPVQNIGAYGVELRDVFEAVQVLDRRRGEVRWLQEQDCAFAYRHSIFKAEQGRYVILRLRLRLSTRPQLNVEYGPLSAAWQATGLQRADSRVVAELVCNIRRSKLPDPAVIGNAGSFFKNPLVSASQAADLAQRWPGLPCYPQPDGRHKVAAGWLIEQAGWKGYRQGNVGVHAQQALVLVNHGSARGEEIVALAQAIQGDVLDKFGVELEMEPQLIGG